MLLGHHHDFQEVHTASFRSVPCLGPAFFLTAGTSSPKRTRNVESNGELSGEDGAPLVCPYSDSQSLLRGSSSFVGMACVIIIRSWDVGSEAHALCRL